MNWCADRVFHDIGIAHPIWCGNDDFIALLHQNADYVENGMLAANVYDTFFRLVSGFQFPLVPGADGFAQRHNATSGRVLRVVLLDGANGGLLDVIGRRKIRLAGAEVRDIYTFRFQLFGFGNYRRSGRDLDAIDAFSQLHAFSSWLRRFVLSLEGHFAGVHCSDFSAHFAKFLRAADLPQRAVRVLAAARRVGRSRAPASNSDSYTFRPAA